jgi:hypothetical protein
MLSLLVAFDGVVSVEVIVIASGGSIILQGITEALLWDRILNARYVCLLYNAQ